MCVREREVLHSLCAQHMVVSCLKVVTREHHHHKAIVIFICIGRHHLVETIKNPCKRSYFCLLDYYFWHGKERLHSQFNHLFHLGVKEVGDILESRSHRFLDFVEAWWLLRIQPVMGLLGKNYIVKHGWRFRAKLIRSFVSSSWPTYLVCIRKKLKLHGTERIEREYLGQKRSWKYHNNVDHLVNLWVLGGDEGKIASEINDYIVTL